MPLKTQDLLAERWTLSKDKGAVDVARDGEPRAHIRQMLLKPVLGREDEVARADLRARLLLTTQNAYRLALMLGGLAKQRDERGDSGAGGLLLSDVEWRLLRQLARDVLTVTGDL